VLPIAYSQAGSFGTTLVPSLENWLIAIDRYVFGINWYLRQPPAPGAANTLFQSAYLANYALLFLAFVLAATLRAAPSTQVGRRSWRERLGEGSDPVMLHSICGSIMCGLLFCYAIFPLLPAVTPRLYFPALRHPLESTVQDVNWSLLSRYSIPYGIFPSGHVAGPVAIGCALAARRRRVLSAVFLVAALLIAIATVYGNYHFVCDAVGGWLAGVAAWFTVERSIISRLKSQIGSDEEARPEVAEEVSAA
jgi:membrane-associated phospholipid phosphatase